MVIRWWEQRSGPQRVDLYTRGTLYSMTASEPLVAALIVSSVDGSRPAGVAAFLGVSVVHTAFALMVMRGGIEWYLGRRPWPVRTTVALAVLTALGTFAAAAAFGVDSPVETGSANGAGTGTMLFVGVLVAALTPRLPTRRLLVTIVVAAVAIGAMGLAVGWPARNAAAIAASTALAFVSAGSAFRASVWMLGIVWELDRSRRVQAELAVAEERLRFSRDLHDIIGRNLSVIAVKSELAAALARRGRSEAGDEMIAVRDIAQESLREVREVVRGYREVDLTTELAGARSVLRSAGVSTRVIGDGDELPPDVQSVLGWVAREGTTNVLRHSHAASCVITVSRDSGAVTLTMENDGVPPDSNDTNGSGLSGLAERLRQMGGELSTGRTGDGFRLSARVPAGVVNGGVGE